MGIIGYFAYRYKRKYYRQYIRYGTEPHFSGEELARSIPRDAGKREGKTHNAPMLPAKLMNLVSTAWIQEKIKMLEQVEPSKEQVRCPCMDENPDEDSAGFEVLHSPDWLKSHGVNWVYVIDLDNHVFSIGFGYDYAHIKFDNMIPDYPGLGGYFDLEEGAEIPDKHLTTDVDLWPDSDLDASEVQQRYNNLQAAIVSPSEWGAPTWEALSISQQLSVRVLEPLVRVGSYTVGAAHFSQYRRDIGKFCYRVVSVAAPSDIICAPQIEAYHALHHRNTSIGFKSGESVEEFIKKFNEVDRKWFSPRLEKVLLNVYRSHRFRGCLIVFCTRLDEPISLMHEVGRVVEILRKSAHPEVGILVSRWQIVAVAIHESKVCHSPALDFNNHCGELCDGILLMMHLLSPLFTAPKVPWSDPPPHNPFSTRIRLPLEIMEYVIHFVDFETYLNLRSISRTIRNLCLARPRVGQYTILGTRPGHGNVFRVQHRNSSFSMDATFTRIKERSYVPCIGGIWDMIGDGEEPEGSDSDWE